MDSLTTKFNILMLIQTETNVLHPQRLIHRTAKTPAWAAVLHGALVAAFGATNRFKHLFGGKRSSAHRNSFNLHGLGKGCFALWVPTGPACGFHRISLSRCAFHLLQKRFIRNFGVGWSSKGFSNDVRSVMMRLFRISISLRGIIWGGLCVADGEGIYWVMLACMYIYQRVPWLW